TNPDGRGGKGTELFAVTSNGGGNNSTCTPQITTACPTGSGCLDPGFNGTGQVLTNTDGNVPSGSDFNEARALMAQPDGKLVAVGHTSVPSGTGYVTHIFAARYNSDGTLDTADFGDRNSLGNRTGITRISLGYQDTMYFSAPGTIYTDATGNERILAAGYTQNSGGGTAIMFVVRLNADGSLDSTFGDVDPNTLLRTGKKLIQIGSSTSTGARSIAAQLFNGVPEIVVAGYANGQGAIFKLLDNGDLDTSFNGQGYINLNQSALSVALQPDGKILAGGARVTSSKNNTTDFAITRLTTAGQMDATFGSGGQVATDFFGQSD